MKTLLAPTLLRVKHITLRHNISTPPATATAFTIQFSLLHRPSLPQSAQARPSLSQLQLCDLLGNFELHLYKHIYNIK